MGDEIDEDAAWEAAHGVDDDAGWQPGGGSDSEEEEELFGTAAIKLKQQQQEDAMWAEINAEFDFTQDRVEDFALKSLTIAEQNFGFRVPDPDLDFTEEFEGSVKKAQQEIETGRVEIPDDGIFIKSARLSAQRGSDVYFKLQHVKATSDHDKPLQVLDSLQAGYLNILSIFRRVRLPETLAAAKKVAAGEGAVVFGNAYAYAERLIHGASIAVKRLQALLSEVRTAISDARQTILKIEATADATLALTHVTQRRVLCMTAAHRFVIATRSLAIAFVTAAVLSRPVLSFFGSKNASSMETQFYYFLGESAKIVNNQKRIAHKQNAPPAVLADVDAVHSVFAKDFQALRMELDLAGKAAHHNARVLWAQALAHPVDLDLRCSLYPTVVSALAAYLRVSTVSSDRLLAATFEIPMTIRRRRCLSLAPVTVCGISPDGTVSETSSVCFAFVAGHYLVLTHSTAAAATAPSSWNCGKGGVVVLTLRDGAGVATCHESSVYSLTAAGFNATQATTDPSPCGPLAAPEVQALARLPAAEGVRSVVVKQCTEVAPATRIGAVLLTLADASAALNMVSALCVGANEESQSQRFSNTPTKAGAEYDVILRPGESLTLFLGGGDQQADGTLAPVVIEDKAALLPKEQQSGPVIALGDELVAVNGESDIALAGLQKVSAHLLQLQSAERRLTFRRKKSVPLASASFRPPHNAHALHRILIKKLSEDELVALQSAQHGLGGDGAVIHDFTELCNGRIQNLAALVKAGVVTLPSNGAVVRKVTSAGTSVFRVSLDPASSENGDVIDDVTTRAALLAVPDFASQAVANPDRNRQDSVLLLRRVLQRVGLRLYAFDPAARCCSSRLELLDAAAFFRAIGHLGRQSGAFPVDKPPLLGATPDQVELWLQVDHTARSSAAPVELDDEEHSTAADVSQPQWLEVCSEVLPVLEDDGSGTPVAVSPRPRRASGSNATAQSFWWLRERELLVAGPGLGSGTSSQLPSAVYVPPLESFTHTPVPASITATSWLAFNLLDISHVYIHDGNPSAVGGGKRAGGAAVATDLADEVKECIHNVAYGPWAGSSVRLFLGVGSTARRLCATFKSPKAASHFVACLRNNILAAQRDTPVLWEGWVKRSFGLGFKSQFLQVRPSGLYFYGRPAPTGCNKDCIRWFARSSSVVLEASGRNCTVRYPKRPGMPNLNALASGDGRAAAIDLDTILRLAAGEEGLAALPAATGKVGLGLGNASSTVVCKFSVTEPAKFEGLQTAFDSMTRFQQRAEARRQDLLVQALAVDHEVEQELAETAREMGVQLKAGWEASALRPILHKLADELIGFW